MVSLEIWAVIFRKYSFLMFKTISRISRSWDSLDRNWALSTHAHFRFITRTLYTLQRYTAVWSFPVFPIPYFIIVLRFTRDPMMWNSSMRRTREFWFRFLESSFMHCASSNSSFPFEVDFFSIRFQALNSSFLRHISDQILAFSS